MEIRGKIKEGFQIGLGCLSMLLILIVMILFSVGVIKLFEWLEPFLIVCLKILGIIIFVLIVSLVFYFVKKYIDSCIAKVEGKPFLTLLRNSILSLILTSIIIFGLGAGCVKCTDLYDSDYVEYNPDVEHLRPDRF